MNIPWMALDFLEEFTMNSPFIINLKVVNQVYARYDRSFNFRRIDQELSIYRNIWLVREYCGGAKLSNSNTK